MDILLQLPQHDRKQRRVESNQGQIPSLPLINLGILGSSVNSHSSIFLPCKTGAIITNLVILMQGLKSDDLYKKALSISDARNKCLTLYPWGQLLLPTSFTGGEGMDFK